MIKSFIQFALIGGLATLVQYSALVLKIEILEVDSQISAATSYAVGAVITYLLNYHITFNRSVSHKIAIPKFALINITGLFMNAMIFYTGTQLLEVHYMLAQMSATMIILFWNFLLNYYWNFKKGIS